MTASLFLFIIDDDDWSELQTLGGSK